MKLKEVCKIGVNESACISEPCVVKFRVQHVQGTIPASSNESEMSVTHKHATSGTCHLAGTLVLFTSAEAAVHLSHSDLFMLTQRQQALHLRPPPPPLRACANTHWWEIPSKNSTLSSPLWAHSCVFQNISPLLKWNSNLQLWRSFEDPAYPQASNKSSSTEDIACKLISLLDFLDAVRFGNVRERERTGRAAKD